MINDTKTHAQEDVRKKERVEQKNRAETLGYQAEKQLLENGENSLLIKGKFGF